MVKRIKYSELIKKFGGNATHMELGTKKEIFDEENEDRRLLLESDEADSALNESKNIEIEAAASEYSHYEEDEDGKVRRIMVKKPRVVESPNVKHIKEMEVVFQSETKGQNLRSVA